jgi:hypothetical protein
VIAAKHSALMEYDHRVNIAWLAVVLALGFLDSEKDRATNQRSNKKGALARPLFTGKGAKSLSHKDLTKSVAYFRTSSMSNVGEDKDTLKRQRAAVYAFAKAGKRSLREVAVELEAAGHVTSAGTRYGAAAVARMIR